MEKNIKVIVSDSSQSPEIKGGWASVQNKLSVLNLDPDSIRSQLEQQVNTFKKILNDMNDPNDTYVIEGLKIQFCITKNGEISIAGFLGAEISNATSIEVEIKRKNL